jgi:hypothetical protein
MGDSAATKASPVSSPLASSPPARIAVPQPIGDGAPITADEQVEVGESSGGGRYYIGLSSRQYTLAMLHC